ncbi:hypothetical protein V8B55DRAFT_1468246, partial [Mucor lusitanicus]
MNYIHSTFYYFFLSRDTVHACVSLLYCDLFFPLFLHATIFELLYHSAMVYLLMHCIASSAALFCGVAFHSFCSSCITFFVILLVVLLVFFASYEASTILFATTFFFLALVIWMMHIACYLFVC